jgi:hypothetical protein
MSVDGTCKRIAFATTNTIIDPYAVEDEIRLTCNCIAKYGHRITPLGVHVLMNYDERDRPTFNYKGKLFLVPLHLIQYWLERWGVIESPAGSEISEYTRQTIVDVWDYSNAAGVGDKKSVDSAYAWFNARLAGLRGESIHPLSRDTIERAVMHKD